MNKKFAFNSNTFCKQYVPKMILVWLPIPVLLNVLAALNGTWSVVLCLVVFLIAGSPLFGIYYYQKRLRRDSYVMLSDSYITYFYIRKDAYMSETASYEYEAREIIVAYPFSNHIEGNQIRITGNVVERIFKERDHKNPLIKNHNAYKIPTYFGEPNELLTILNKHKKNK